MTKESFTAESENEQFTRHQMQEQFDQLAMSPDMQATPLSHASLELGQTPISQAEDGTEILAMLEIPATEESNGYLMIGRHPDKGFFIAGPRTQKRELDKGNDERIDPSKGAIELGTYDGTVTLGKSGVILNGPNLTDGHEFKMPTRFALPVTSEFSDLTSRKHATIEIRQGKLTITDHSTNGTKVITRKTSQ
jgi:hypothetical protein